MGFRKGKAFADQRRMGVKPLFYTVANSHLIFGSEIKAILAHPDYQRDINYEAIYHYFTFKNVPSPLTAFKDIYSLLPGEILIFSKNRDLKKEDGGRFDSMKKKIRMKLFQRENIGIAGRCHTSSDDQRCTIRRLFERWCGLKFNCRIDDKVY